MLKRIARMGRRLVPVPARRWAQRVGNFLADGSSFPSLSGSLRVLRERGFQPRRVIDVGAYQGEWARIFQSFFPGTRILMIDALEAQEPRLRELARDSGGTLCYEIALLSSSEGQEVEFHEMATGSSIFAERSHYPRVTRKRTTRTLDGLVLGSHPEFRAPDFLKLDTQGSELEVLKGGSEVLANCQAVLLETSLIPINDGCPVLADVLDFMRDRGLLLYDFCSQPRRRDGVLWQMDLLLLHRTSPLVPEPRLTAENPVV